MWLMCVFLTSSSVDHHDHRNKYVELHDDLGRCLCQFWAKELQIYTQLHT